MCISLAQSATLSQIARVEAIIDQTDGEEFASMLKDRRSVNEVSEVPVDLNRAIQSQTHRRVEYDPGPHTAFILMISWPGRCRLICSKISTGSVVM